MLQCIQISYSRVPDAKTLEVHPHQGVSQTTKEQNKKEKQPKLKRKKIRKTRLFRQKIPKSQLPLKKPPSLQSVFSVGHLLDISTLPSVTNMPTNRRTG